MLEGFVGWAADFERKYHQSGYWQDHALGDIIEDGMKKFPDRVAISFEGKHITYGELCRKVNRLALHLLDMGHKPLDRIILQLSNVRIE
jgi:non-ribosomal peptide synthetase component E (peptide arylation enzyme)